MTESKTPAKKAPAKRAAAKKTAASASDPLEVVRADTPNPDLTDLDRDPAGVCRFCGRDADTDGMCTKHAARRGADL